MTAAVRASCHGLARRRRQPSRSTRPRNGLTMAFIMGTVMPRKRSPSPYSPGPVRKYRRACAARAGSPAAASRSNNSASAVIRLPRDDAGVVLRFTGSPFLSERNREFYSYNMPISPVNAMIFTRSEGYASICNLCVSIRITLPRLGGYPELQPAVFYR